MSELTVVIPALNEAAALPMLLAQLRLQKDVLLEVIVADGGSTDGTDTLATGAGATVVRAPRGRGAQMNAGAAQAKAPLLLFLHADSAFSSPLQLRRAIDALSRDFVANGGRIAGHFALRFARSVPGRDFFYRYLEEKTALGRPYTINGDQGLLLGKTYFRELGGFDERLPFLEDQRIAGRIFESGKWILFDTPLVTSARRFEAEGPHRRYTLMALIMGLHAAQAQEWFAGATQVYAEQAQTGRLRVGAWLALTWSVLIAAGPRRAWQILFAAGRFSRQNSWQLFYWWDALLRPILGPDRYPFLNFHDRVVARITGNVVIDVLATVNISIWFLLVLTPVYFVLDLWERPMAARSRVT